MQMCRHERMVRYHGCLPRQTWAGAIHEQRPAAMLADAALLIGACQKHHLETTLGHGLLS